MTGFSHQSGPFSSYYWPAFRDDTELAPPPPKPPGIIETLTDEQTKHNFTWFSRGVARVDGGGGGGNHTIPTRIIIFYLGGFVRRGCSFASAKFSAA